MDSFSFYLGLALLLGALMALARPAIHARAHQKFVQRWGIDEAELYLRTDIPASVPPEIYERRVSLSPTFGGPSNGGFVVPVQEEAFRLVSTRPDVGYAAPVSDWFVNAYESREGGHPELRQLVALRPLTDEELTALWPQVAHKSLQCDRQLMRRALTPF